MLINSKTLFCLSYLKNFYGLTKKKFKMYLAKVVFGHLFLSIFQNSKKVLGKVNHLI
jgi:hypothetical protein